MDIKPRSYVSLKTTWPTELKPIGIHLQANTSLQYIVKYEINYRSSKDIISLV